MDYLTPIKSLCQVKDNRPYQDRCGYGPRLPFLVISPFARQNNVDHTVNDQTSILRFIEDNWGLGRIGDQSFDALANSILGHFDFTEAHIKPVLLNPASGEVTKNPND
jgi:phospholipase C